MTAPVDIVGAGPAGLTLALLLAQRGRRVRVFDRRADPRGAAPERGRSINLALAARGMHALRAAGALERLQPHCVRMPGRMLHVDGTQQFIPYGQRPAETLYSISRAALHEELTLAAAAQSRIELRFGQRCLDVRLRDDGVNLLRLRAEVGAADYELESTFTIGADGAGSALRDALAAQGLVQVREERLAHGYQEFTLAAVAGRHAFEPQALHIWPRGGYMLIALPNTDGSFTATLFLPEAGSESFATLDATRLRALFAREFADVLPLLPDLEAQFLAHPRGALGSVYCAPWQARGRVLLLGDAAHAIVPFHGQGMNCALEDCLLFDQLLADGADPASACARFETRRRPDTDAIAQMALENYEEMRDSVRDPHWQAQKTLALQLEQRFAERFIPRYSMVMFHAEIGYADALRRGAVQQQILDELSADGREAVDWQLAARLVTQRLAPLPAPV